MIEQKFYDMDKSELPDGPWQIEPDKIQWTDPDTGYACLIVRTAMGNLCGYVGVMPDHPLHSVDYNMCPHNCGEQYCEHTPSSVMQVHGGLTYADKPPLLSEEQWHQHGKRLPKYVETAAQYPQGDAARHLKEWAHLIGDYDMWRRHMEETTICLVDEGNTGIWWLGFDCAHAWDIVPATMKYRRPDNDDVYRDVDYVRGECHNLAKQLSEYASTHQRRPAWQKFFLLRIHNMKRWWMLKALPWKVRRLQRALDRKKAKSSS